MAKRRPSGKRPRPRRPARTRDDWDDEDELDPEIEEEQELKGLMRMAERTDVHMREQHGEEPDPPLLQTVKLPVPVQVLAALRDEIVFRYPTPVDLRKSMDQALAELADRGGPLTEARVNEAMSQILLRRLSGLKRSVFDRMHPLSLEAVSEAVELFTPSSPEEEEQ